jgi:hypothetical protein
MSGTVSSTNAVARGNDAFQEFVPIELMGL